MANYAHRSTFLYFFALFWLLTALTPVFGGGSRDADLSRADELINEKKYDEAIPILSNYARRHPEHFDQAQRRLRKIFMIREEFNRTAEELMQTLYNDPDNSEKILELSIRLGTLEDEDSPLVLSFLARTHGVAQFNVYRNRLRTILERGRAFIDSGDSESALQTYAGGMGFMRENFFASGHGEIIENDVRRETESVNLALGAFRQDSTNLGAIAAEFVRALDSGNLARAPEILSRLTPAMDRFIELHQRLNTAFGTFDKILEEIREAEPEMGDRNHLAFFSRVIYGRPGEQVQEGMLGAVELYWENSVGSIISAIIRNAEDVNATGLVAFSDGEFLSAIESFNRIPEYTGFSALFFEKYRMFHEGGNRQFVLAFDNQIMNGNIPAFARIKSLSEAGDYMKQASVLAGRMDTLVNIDRSSLESWRAGNISTAAAINTELRTRSIIARMHGEINNVIDTAHQMDELISYFYITQHIKTAIKMMENMRSIAADEERQSAYRYYRIAGNDLGGNLADRREELERGRNLIEGQRRVTEDGVVIVDHYPTEALAAITAMLSELSGDLDRGNSLLTSYRNEPPVIIAYEGISAMQSSSQATVDEMLSIRDQGLALVETARGQIARSITFRQEGERLFREAQNAFQRQNFDAARERLQRASERFSNSLGIQESASLRQSWDNQMMNLGQAINNAENEMIIAEVRNLVNNARVTYFAGNFQQAEDSLIRARNRWRLTNPNENEEILYWLGIVRGAMSARSGRVIPATAPLFPEMSQLLSGARKNFEEGVRLINAGSRQQGLEKFNDARRQTREVRLMFPVNQEAGILEMRMEQFTDPAAFSASFAQRLRNAVAGTKQRSIESFAELQNLAEINPGYPGIRGILTQAEIDMGYRPPPPNPRDLARSQELTASASRILEGSATALFDVALTQINEAIVLNPENVEATRVKDRLLNRMSVPGAVVLSTEDENEYQRAVRELQAGNNLLAFALVERLMQNPRNRNITKLLELQRRINSVL
jgi:tetratricopeptide (TPR) repeat protein